MGICIHLAIAKSVTKKEWKAVYEESLKMIDFFPLAEKRKVDIDGIETICLVKTRECEETCGWYEEKTRTGWDAVGDYEYMCTAEDYYLPRDLVEENDYVKNVKMPCLGCFLLIWIMIGMTKDSILFMKYGGTKLRVSHIICICWLLRV